MRVERLFVRVSSMGKVASESVIRVFVFGCRGLSALGQVPPAPKEDTPLVCHQLTLGVEGNGQLREGCLVSLGLRRCHFLLVFVDHVFPQSEG